jgi:hypothetical protein
MAGLSQSLREELAARDATVGLLLSPRVIPAGMERMAGLSQSLRGGLAVRGAMAGSWQSRLGERAANYQTAESKSYSEPIPKRAWTCSRPFFICARVTQRRITAKGTAPEPGPPPWAGPPPPRESVGR